MKSKVVFILIMSLLFTAIGIVCGWYGASRSLGPASHGAELESEPDGQAGDSAPILSQEAMKNMGVRVTPAKLSSFSRHQQVSAVVAAAPGAKQGVYAPAAGRIRSVAAGFGAVVRSNDVLVTLVRDPLTLATLELTGDVLKPVSENLHETNTRAPSETFRETEKLFVFRVHTGSHQYRTKKPPVSCLRFLRFWRGRKL